MEQLPVPTPHPPRADGGRRAVPTTGGIDPLAVEYWTRVAAVLRRQAVRVAGQDADDVIQRVALQFWCDPSKYMGDYEPEVFAAVALRSRAEDQRRSDRIERGEGARLVTDRHTGLRRSAREVCSYDAIDPEDEFLGADDAMEWRAMTADVLRDAMRLLEPKIADVLLLLADGYSVTEAAERVGLSRSYASRRVSAAKRLLAEVIVAA